MDYVANIKRSVVRTARLNVRVVSFIAVCLLVNGLGVAVIDAQPVNATKNVAVNAREFISVQVVVDKAQLATLADTGYSEIYRKKVKGQWHVYLGRFDHRRDAVKGLNQILQHAGKQTRPLLVGFTPYQPTPRIRSFMEWSNNVGVVSATTATVDREAKRKPVTTVSVTAPLETVETTTLSERVATIATAPQPVIQKKKTIVSRAQPSENKGDLSQQLPQAPTSVGHSAAPKTGERALQAAYRIVLASLSKSTSLNNIVSMFSDVPLYCYQRSSGLYIVMTDTYENKEAAISALRANAQWQALGANVINNQKTVASCSDFLVRK